MSGTWPFAYWDSIRVDAERVCSLAGTEHDTGLSPSRAQTGGFDGAFCTQTGGKSLSLASDPVGHVEIHTCVGSCLCPAQAGTEPALRDSVQHRQRRRREFAAEQVLIHGTGQCRIELPFLWADSFLSIRIHLKGHLLLEASQKLPWTFQGMLCLV